MNDREAEVDERAGIEKLSQKSVRAVLNCLTESTFFYRADDRDTFDYLRRHRAEFERFFHHYFDWDLHVDRKAARLFRRGGPFNAGLTPRQRDLFDLTRRDECLVFMLLLEFHEREMAAQNQSYEQDEDVRFLISDFFAHVLARYREELGERAPADRELWGHVRTVFRELERHRFVRLLERGAPADSDLLPEGQSEQELWTFLPGIHCYDPGRLNREIFRQAYGVGEAGQGAALAQGELGLDGPAASGAGEAPALGSPAGDSAAGGDAGAAAAALDVGAWPDRAGPADGAASPDAAGPTAGAGSTGAGASPDAVLRADPGGEETR